ncbi:Uncharacterised protein [uncultured archaeon]|nr:Uncharacterised protein [uncultured archaeon]
MNKAWKACSAGNSPDNPRETTEDKDKNANKQEKGQKRRKTFLSTVNRPLLGFELTPRCGNQCRGTREKTRIKISPFKLRFDDLIDNSSCHQIRQPSFEAPADLDPDLSLLFGDHEDDPVVLQLLPDLPGLRHFDGELFKVFSLQGGNGQNDDLRRIRLLKGPQPFFDL